MKVKEILNLTEKDLKNKMTEKDFERIEKLGLEVWQLLDALQDSARLSNQDENEDHINISNYLDFLENMKN